MRQHWGTKKKLQDEICLQPRPKQNCWSVSHLQSKTRHKLSGLSFFWYTGCSGTIYPNLLLRSTRSSKFRRTMSLGWIKLARLGRNTICLYLRFKKKITPCSLLTHDNLAFDRHENESYFLQITVISIVMTLPNPFKFAVRYWCHSLFLTRFRLWKLFPKFSFDRRMVHPKS